MFEQKRNSIAKFTPGQQMEHLYIRGYLKKSKFHSKSILDCFVQMNSSQPGILVQLVGTQDQV